MSDTIRAILRERQNPQDAAMLQSLYQQLLGQTMASPMLEQYSPATEPTLQQDMAFGNDARLMRPMISSVPQLDR